MGRDRQAADDGSAAELVWALVSVAKADVAGRLAYALRSYDVACVPTFDPRGMLTHLESAPAFAVVVLDSHLPPSTGLATLSQIVAAARSRTDAAILTLGGQAQVNEHQADADLPPSASVDAIAAAASALASARQRLLPEVSGASPLQLDTATHEVRIGNARPSVTQQQFRLLARLAAAKGATVSHRELATAAYGRAHPGDNQRIRAHIARLRHRLQREAPDAIEIVATGRGLGYRLIWPIQSSE